MELTKIDAYFFTCSLALIFFHSYTILGKTYGVTFNRLIHLASLSFFVKSGNSQPSIQYLYQRNIWFSMVLISTALMCQDRLLLENIKQDPWTFLFKWITMTSTIDSKIMNFSGIYIGPLWYLHTEFILNFIRSFGHSYMLLLIGILLKLDSYEDLDTNFNLNDMFDPRNNQDVVDFVFRQNFSVTSNLAAFMFGHILREQGIRIKLKNEFIKRFSMITFGFHMYAIYNLPVQTVFMKFFLTVCSMLIISYGIKPMYKS